MKSIFCALEGPMLLDFTRWSTIYYDMGVAVWKLSRSVSNRGCLVSQADLALTFRIRPAIEGIPNAFMEFLHMVLTPLSIRHRVQGYLGSRTAESQLDIMLVPRKSTFLGF